MDDNIGRLSIVQANLIRKKRSSDFLRRIIAPVDGMGEVTVSYVCPHCNCFLLDDHIWWWDTETATTGKKKHCSWWCAPRGGQHQWRAPNRIKVVQIGANANEAKVYKAHAAPLGLFDNLINALKLLANQQKDDDSPIRSIATGLHERSRRDFMDVLRRFLEADNHSAADVGNLRRGTKAANVKKPLFSEACVNTNAFVPGYSSRLCGNCGSSTWRRVFT